MNFNKNDIIISKMTLEDLIIIKDQLDNFDNFWSYNTFKSEIENDQSIYIKATFKNDIIGIAGIWISVDDIHITNIFTKESFKRLGIATKLLEELLAISNTFEKKEITLEVNEKNYKAINLYKKFNFKEVGIRKKYYNNLESAIIMTLHLKQI